MRFYQSRLVEIRLQWAQISLEKLRKRTFMSKPIKQIAATNLALSGMKCVLPLRRSTLNSKLQPIVVSFEWSSTKRQCLVIASGSSLRVLYSTRANLDLLRQQLTDDVVLSPLLEAPIATLLTFARAVVIATFDPESKDDTATLTVTGFEASNRAVEEIARLQVVRLPRLLVRHQNESAREQATTVGRKAACQ
jgi:hypothetical protein